MKRYSIKIEQHAVAIESQNGEVWLTQCEIADTFGVFVSAVNMNITSILKSGILNREKVCKVIVLPNGNLVEQYNLEMIIALSFRLSSWQSTIFRKWLVKNSIAKTKTPIYI